MSASKPQKSDKAPQMKIIIGMVQNSYRLINELMTKIDGLGMRIDKLCSSLSDLSNPNFEDTKMGRTFNTLSQLLLTSTAYNLNESMTKPAIQPAPVILQAPPAGAPAGQPAVVQTQPQVAGQAVQGTEAVPVPQGNEPSLLKPSKLFKKLNK
ncbi:MAG: hypothetical protein ACXACA_02595 [Candidatus Ranarchaeia archaeon]|jgi:hypothetical protein